MRIVRARGWWAWVAWTAAFTIVGLAFLGGGLAAAGFGGMVLLSAVISAERRAVIPGLVAASGLVVGLAGLLADPLEPVVAGIGGAVLAGGAALFATGRAALGSRRETGA